MKQYSREEILNEIMQNGERPVAVQPDYLVMAFGFKRMPGEEILMRKLFSSKSEMDLQKLPFPEMQNNIEEWANENHITSHFNTTYSHFVFAIKRERHEETGRPIIASTFGIQILPERRCGNTTRIIDNAIQIIFRGQVCRVVDHASGNSEANFRLYEKIMKRLNFENYGERYVGDKGRLLIWLNK